MLTRRRLLALPFAAAALAAAPQLGAAGQTPAARPLADLEDIARAETYLNRIKTMRARFIQIASNGSYAEGVVSLHRPGRMRFEYDPPHPVLLIADGLNLLFYDKELKQATFIPLWETPLWFLLREKVDLTHAVRVTEVARGDGALRMSMEERGAEGEGGAVTLVFSERPFALRKWEVTDAQGVTTTVALLNPRFDVALADELFEYGDLDPYGFRSGRNKP